VRPLPNDGSATYRLRTIFYKKDDELSEAVPENLWMLHYPDLLIAMAGKVLAGRYIKQRDVLKDFILDEAAELHRYETDNLAREYANREFYEED
jgi:hypothetical protein